MCSKNASCAGRTNFISWTKHVSVTPILSCRDNSHNSTIQQQPLPSAANEVSVDRALHIFVNLYGSHGLHTAVGQMDFLLCLVLIKLNSYMWLVAVVLDRTTL